MDNIGANIAELRKAKGVAQEALAAAAGVTVQAVSKWENGGAPDTALLPAIADFFGVPVDALFGRGADGCSANRIRLSRYSGSAGGCFTTKQAWSLISSRNGSFAASSAFTDAQADKQLEVLQRPRIADINILQSNPPMPHYMDERRLSEG